MCHICYTKYSITFKLPHGKGNECKRDVCMIAPCIFNLMKAFLLFPALSFFFFLSSNIYKFLYLLSFHSKVLSSKSYILLLSLHFEALYVSENFYAFNIFTFIALFFKPVLSLKLLSRFLALNAFFIF